MDYMTALKEGYSCAWLYIDPLESVRQNDGFDHIHKTFQT